MTADSSGPGLPGKAELPVWSVWSATLLLSVTEIMKFHIRCTNGIRAAAYPPGVSFGGTSPEIRGMECASRMQNSGHADVCRLDPCKLYMLLEKGAPGPRLPCRERGTPHVVIYQNWLNYYVYQTTPYNLNQMK